MPQGKGTYILHTYAYAYAYAYIYAYTYTSSTGYSCATGARAGVVSTSELRRFEAYNSRMKTISALPLLPEDVACSDF